MKKKKKVKLKIIIFNKEGPSYKKKKLNWIIEKYIVYPEKLADNYIKIDKSYLKNSGLIGVDKLILYNRESTKKQIEFIQNDVLDKNIVGWILGPPGNFYNL